MKNKSNSKLLISSGLLLAWALAMPLALVPPAQAQTAEPVPAKMDDKMMQQCKEMKEKKEKMAEDMKSQDAELTAHVAKMNATPDDKKANEIAAVVTHMVEQQTAMDARMAKMEEEMMEHMMQHMQMGKEGMSMCPMMKGMKDMKDMDDKSADGKMKMEGKMMEHCQAMKEQKEKMAADTKSQDAELAAHVAKMNATSDGKKTNEIAAVVTHLVEQRIAMAVRKAKMEEEMMEHMMQHMQMGKDGMSKCPMMKGMKDMDEKAPSAR